MGVRVEVDPGFCGPSLRELGTTVRDIPDDPLRVRWEGTREEAAAVGALRGSREVVIVAPDPEGMATAAFALGAAIQVEGARAAAAAVALADRRSYDWRAHSSAAGPALSRALVVKLGADAVRQGKRPRVARVAVDVLQGRASAADADLLIRL